MPNCLPIGYDLQPYCTNWGAFELSQTTNITYKKLDVQKGKSDRDRETKLIWKKKTIHFSVMIFQFGHNFVKVVAKNVCSSFSKGKELCSCI